MALKSTSERFGSVTITIHWLTALLTLALLTAGFYAANTPDEAQKAAILRIHAPIGLLVLALTAFRVIWRLVLEPTPKETSEFPRALTIAAKAVQGLLYLTLLGLGASGLILMRVSGAADVIFDHAIKPLPDFLDFRVFYAHGALAIIFILLAVGHTAAAFYHQYISKDPIFGRMGLGK